jgi:hypothetical protein
MSMNTLSVIQITIITLLLISCGSGSETYKATSETYEPTYVSSRIIIPDLMVSGQTYEPYILETYSDGTLKKTLENVTWSSSNAKVASISATNMVNAHWAGSTIIYSFDTVNERKLESKVTVHHEKIPHSKFDFKCHQAESKVLSITTGKLVLSFDDHYVEDWRDALPILARYGVKATFFISDWDTFIPMILQLARIIEDCFRS